MPHRKSLEAIQALARLESDCARAYSQILVTAHEPTVIEECVAIRSTHRRHLMNLTLLLARYGEQVDQSQRQTRFSNLSITGVAPDAGSLAAVLAAKENEAVVDRAYKRILSPSLPVDIRRVLIGNHTVIRSHIRYLNRVLADSFGISTVVGQRPSAAMAQFVAAGL